VLVRLLVRSLAQSLLLAAGCWLLAAVAVVVGHVNASAAEVDLLRAQLEELKLDLQYQLQQETERRQQEVLIETGQLARTCL
jgi:hypothetical protein